MAIGAPPQIAARRTAMATAPARTCFGSPQLEDEPGPPEAWSQSSRGVRFLVRAPHTEPGRVAPRGGGSALARTMGHPGLRDTELVARAGFVLLEDGGANLG